MGVKLHSSEKDRERVKTDWSAWWTHELDRPMVMIETPHLVVMPNETWSREFLFEKPVEELIDYIQSRLEQKRFYGDALPKWWPNFGPGIVAGFLGANVNCRPDECTVWFNVDQPKKIEDLRFEFNPDNAWWRRVKEITRRAVERWGDQVCVGHTDLGGNLDTMFPFLGKDQLLLEMYDAPDQVLRLAKELTRVWLGCYDRLYEIIRRSGRGSSNWAEVWSPGRCYMFQSDLSYMLSPKMFEKFVLPDLSTCFAAVDNAFYHLDGKGQIAHLDLLLSLEELDGIQWIPGAGERPPEEWLPLLKRIRDAGKLCQVYVSAEGARKIARELEGKGFAFYIIPFPTMSGDQARDYLS